MAKKIDLYSTFEEKGDWWIPKNPSLKLRGRISYDPSQGALLKLDGSFFGLEETINHTYENPDMIIGELDSGNYVTLIKNIISSVSGPLMADKPDVIIYSNRVIYGFAPEDGEAIEFQKCAFRLRFIENWFSSQVFSYQYPQKDNKTAQIFYTPPEEFELNFPDHGIIIESNSWLSGGSLPAFSEGTFEHHRELIIKSEKPNNVEWFLDQIGILNQLLSLLSGHKVQPLKIYFPMKVKYDEQTEMSHEVILLHKPEPLRKEKPPHPAEMPFPYPNIKDTFSDVLKRWFNLRNQVDDPINLFFDAFFRGGSFNHYKFLAITQACESFHFEMREKKDIPHKERMLSLFKELSSKLQTSLITDHDIFFQKALDSRNYYTHYNKKKKAKSFQGVELYWATRKINWMLAIILFQELGFSFETIEKRIFNDHDFVSTIRVKV